MRAWILLFAASVAGVCDASAETRLSWGNCAGGEATTIPLRTFACDTNTGSHTLVASVVPGLDFENWVGFEAELSLRFFSGQQPDWWQLRNPPGGSGACRNGSVSVNAIGAGHTGCQDLYAGSALGGITSYANLAAQPSVSKLAWSFTLPPGSEGVLQQGVEYFVANVVISNAKTAGAGSCAGCDQSVCLALDRVTLIGSAGTGPDEVQAIGGWVSWQGDACTTVSARRSSWENVKSLFR